MVWKVGDVLMASGPTAVHYSFSVQDDRGASLIAFVFATREEAQQARDCAIEMLRNAVGISAGGKFY
jgi:hypothetical protein